ncbi:hypothetical protein F4861DRAFT_537057 [Xylaria intraflava]|nr:hypothetical protein F4861DRAFT_537057 [Xylaria intraflava]
MAHFTFLPQPAVQKQDCPDDASFFRCGDFKGCCTVNPCGFLQNDDPCGAAITSQEHGSGGDGGGDGDGGDGEGGGDEGGDDVTTTLTPTTTRIIVTTVTHMPPHTSTEDSTTDSPASPTDGPPSPTSEASPTGTPVISHPTNSAGVPTTMDTTTLATATGVPGNGTTSADTIPTPSSTSPSKANGEKASLSRPAVLSISVGSAVGGLILLLLIFWLIRRRRLSKRMSSIRGDSPKPDKKSSLDRPVSLTGTALGSQDVFAEFGGRVETHDDSYKRPELYARDARKDEGWPLSSTPATEPYRQDQQFSVSMAKPQPQFPCAELDSAGNEYRGLDIRPGRPPHSMAVNHPSPLTPGYPGTQMPMQHGGGGRNANYYRNGGQGQNQSQVRRNFANATPRATLNATADERLNNFYANSWAHGP